MSEATMSGATKACGVTMRAGGRRWLPSIAVLALFALAPLAKGQGDAAKSGAESKDAQAAQRNGPPPGYLVKTFYLTNISQQNDANELLTAMRNILDPHVRIFLLMSQNAIVVEAPPEQIALAQKLLNDLDRPKKTYRLTYTITDFDGEKRIGTQHFKMIVVTGQRTTLKQGSKVPVPAGTAPSAEGSQAFTYLDVGMSFDATLDEFANGVRLRSKVEQSGIGEEKGAGVYSPPVVRQTVLEGASFLTPGKPLVLGSVDITGSTRHLDVTVVMELVS